MFGVKNNSSRYSNTIHFSSPCQRIESAVYASDEIEEFIMISGHNSSLSLSCLEVYSLYILINLYSLLYLFSPLTRSYFWGDLEFMNAKEY